MKILFIALLCHMSGVSLSQYKDADIEKLNKCAKIDTYIFLNDTIQYLRLRDDTLVSIGDLTFLHSHLTSLNGYSKEAMLNEFYSDIRSLKSKYPTLNVSGYEHIYNFYKEKYEDEKRQLEALKEEQKKQGESYIERMKFESTAKEITYRKELQAVDSANSRQQGNVMYTVKEGNQEFEIGTQKEYLEQKSFDNRNTPHLCRFIGFKYYWVAEIAKYLIEEETFTLESAVVSDRTHSLTIKMYPYFTTEAFYGRLKINAKINKEDRVTSLIVTGNTTSLIHLFLWYWPTTISLQKSSKLKPGYYYKYLFDETIKFNYSPAGAFITVIKRK